tara:strand:- start:344 stop:1774 length:1431 start_codon:yes stop_codon:yes gene_type:complete
MASELPDSSWTIESLNQLNSRSDEVLIGWDGQEIYFGRLNTTSRRESGKQWFLADREDFTAQRLQGWSEFDKPSPTQLIANRFPSWDALGPIQHATVDSDRGVVVLSVWMDDGQFDLFIAQREGGNWSIPKPLEGLNSPYDEVFPNFHEGDLLFGSDRPGGFGGFDVYRSTRRELFAKAHPLPAPVNSGGDELTAVPGGTEAGSGFYVSAVRMGGQGGVDMLWMGPPPRPNAVDSVRLGMEIRYQREPLLDLDVRIRQRGGRHVFSGALDEQGRVEIGALMLDAALEVRFEANKRRKRSLPEGAVCHVYEQCKAEECLNSPWPGWKHMRSYRLSGGEAFVFDLLPLDALGVWNRPTDIDRSILNEGFGSWLGRFESSRPQLAGNDQQELIHWLQSYRGINGEWPEQLTLLIEGHADAKGKSGANENLSMQRAQHVVDIALQLGLPMGRMKAKGWGSAFASGKDQQDRKVTVRWVLN